MLFRSPFIQDKNSNLELDDSVFGTINNVDMLSPLTSKEISSIYGSYKLKNNFKKLYKNSQYRALIFNLRNNKTSDYKGVAEKLNLSNEELNSLILQLILF